MKRRWMKHALEVLALPTAPTREQAVADRVTRFVESKGLSVRRDRWGNLLVHYRLGDALPRPPAFCAHMDHPGFVAGQALNDGAQEAEWRGSVPLEVFVGSRVRFRTETGWTRGVVVEASEDYPRGAFRAVRVRLKRPAPPGGVGMWDFPDPTVRGARIYARGHDDLAGVAAICCLIEDLVRRKVETEVYALFTRYEEGGLFGAIGACKSRTLPKKCVVYALETSMALANARLGDGVVVRVGDRTSIFTPWVTAHAVATAQNLAKRRKGFRYQRRLMDGGTCESSVYCAFGYDAGGLCLPLGNYHNVNRARGTLGPEYIDVNDLEGLILLMLELAARGGASRADEKPRWLEHFAKGEASLMD